MGSPQGQPPLPVYLLSSAIVVLCTVMLAYSQACINFFFFFAQRGGLKLLFDMHVITQQYILVPLFLFQLSVACRK